MALWGDDPARSQSGQTPAPDPGRLNGWLAASARYGFALLFACVALAAGLWFTSRLLDSVTQLTVALVEVENQLEQQTAALIEIRRLLAVLAGQGAA